MALSEGAQKHFSLMLPQADGATRIVLLHNDQILDTRAASAHLPQVNITSHADGATLDGSNTTVQWSATDGDNDSLTATIQYSTDDGTTWQTLITAWPNSSYKLDLPTLARADSAILRVLVSDGFHTTSTQVGVTFPAADRSASLEIVEPATPVTIAVSQTIAFAGIGTDVNNSPFADGQLLWTSDKDGLLGSGVQLSIADLSAGEHTISLRVEGDNEGDVIDTATVTVVENPSLLPPEPDRLTVDTPAIVLSVPNGFTSTTLVIDNQNSVNRLDWTVTSSESWLLVDATSGTTPMRLRVSLNQALLPAGAQTATLNFSSPSVSQQDTEVSVRVENGQAVEMRQIFLPYIQ